MAYTDSVTRKKDDDDYDDEDKPVSRQVRRAQTKAEEKLLKRALDCFKQSNEAYAKQRERELEDAAFDAGDQWPADLLKSRGPQIDPSTGRSMPGRPSLTIPRLDGPIQQVINQQRQASLGITVKPKGNGATVKTAERINGLIRHIQVESRAALARNWAYDRAVKVGRGYYRILKDWANDGDWDVDLIVDRILNQAAVYVDPFHVQPDASDMEWAFIVEDLPITRFKREHGDSVLLKAGEDVLRGIGDNSPGWISFDDAGRLKAVRRAEYWRVVYTEKTLLRTDTGWIGFEEDRPKKGSGKVTDKRTVRKRTVKWVKMTASEVLESEDWEGRYIPIVQVVGREYNVNGERIYKGMISNGKDAQRSYNYMRSKQVEAVGLAPIAPYTMVEGQDEGYEEMWANANVMPFARLIYKPIGIAGQPAPPPQRTSASTDISAITLAAHAASEDIDSITGFSDPSRGRSNPADRSGRAIQALQQRTDQGVSDYLDNLTQISMVHEGRILLDLLPYVYDRPGRIATILDEDLQTSSQVMIGQAYRVGPDGIPIAANPKDPKAEIIDLTKGIYRVVVNVGKSFKTQREEAVGMLGELIAANPQATPLVADVLVENIDAPGFQRLAKRFKVMLPPQIQQLESTEGDLPPAAAAQIAMKDQQLQQQGQQMQAMGKALEEKQAEAQAKMQIEQMKLERDYELKMAELAMKERIEMEKIRTGLAQKSMDVDGRQRAEELRAVTRRIQQEADLRHDAISQDTQFAHERAQAELEARLNGDESA